MKRLLKTLLPKSLIRSLDPIRERWFRDDSRKSYSQEGEDMVLERFLEHRHSGFYVDVGAHHPTRFSNTYRLYLRGWRGLNLDANPGSMAPFRKIRSRDINIEAAVASTHQELTYYAFNEPALNTFSQDLAQERAAGAYSIDKEVRITTKPLSQLLDEYVPANTRIDLLTVDVEGFDLDVLQSNDWSRYTPEFVLVECLSAVKLAEASLDPVAQLLLRHRYCIVAKTMNTVLFQRGEHASDGAV